MNVSRKILALTIAVSMLFTTLTALATVNYAAGSTVSISTTGNDTMGNGVKGSTYQTQTPIRSHGAKLTFANITISNYPDFNQPSPGMSVSLLTDGIANDSKSCFTCNLDKPEYLFDFGSVQWIQSFALAGFTSTAQAVLFKMFISEDDVSWKELGVDVPVKIAQPIIDDKSIYIYENFDDSFNTGRMNPAPTEFDTSTTDEIFTTGNYQTRTHNDVNGNEIDTDCFTSPQMDITISSIDWQSYGFVNNYCNYLFHYFMDDVQSARYVKIVGYGNTSKQWYMWSSFTEVQVFGPDDPTWTQTPTPTSTQVPVSTPTSTKDPMSTSTRTPTPTPVATPTPIQTRTPAPSATPSTVASVNGNISSYGEEDLFTFVANTSGSHIIKSSASFDSYGYLFDSNMVVIGSDDDSGGGGQFQIVRNLTAGCTYYIKIRPYSGSSIGPYSIQVTCPGPAVSLLPYVIPTATPVPIPTHEPGTIGIGEYVQMGKYYDQPILWRCVDIDENGSLMLSDKILTIKPFDVPGDHKYADGTIQADSNINRTRYGSNIWETSDLRSWLNSTEAAGNVTWLDGCPPTAAKVESGYNDYANEKGFLADGNFTEYERNSMKSVTQKSLLNSIDVTKLKVGGTALHINNSYISAVVQNYDTAYYHNVTDKVFILDAKQINKVYQYSYILGTNYCYGKPTQKAVDNSEYKDYNLSSSKNWYSWLRTPSSASSTPSNVRISTVTSQGSLYIDDNIADCNYIGVRSAFYMNQSPVIIKSGDGSQASPFILDDPNATATPIPTSTTSTPIPTQTPTPTPTPTSDRYATRAELCKKIVDLTGLEGPRADLYAIFSDADDINPDCKSAVEILVGSGIVRGNVDGTFSPDYYVTRAEFATVLCRAIEFLNIEINKVNQNPICNDINSHWAQSYINKILEWGLMETDFEGRFYPDDLFKFDDMQAITLANNTTSPEPAPTSTPSSSATPTPTPTVTPAPTPIPTHLLGDATGDGKITSADALKILQSITMKVVLNDVQKFNADVTKNGSVQSSDALKVLQYCSGKITTF